MEPMEPGVLTRKRVVRWIGALFVTSLVVSGLVGSIGASHRFDWSLAAVAGTAFGTVTLAGFTGALAWTTSGDVQATWRLAEAQQKEQLARDRPIVIASVASWTGLKRRGSILDASITV